MKYTIPQLKKLEQLLKNAGLKILYEKGNFKPGFCLLEDKKIIVLNKFLSIEARIATLHDFILNYDFDFENLSDDYKEHILELKQTKIKL